MDQIIVFMNQIIVKKSFKNQVIKGFWNHIYNVFILIAVFHKSHVLPLCKMEMKQVMTPPNPVTGHSQVQIFLRKLAFEILRWLKILERS